MEEYRKLKHGELTDIIIGTVVANPGISAQELVAKCESWNIRITLSHARARLHQLAQQGRIDKVGRNKFEGM